MIFELFFEDGLDEWLCGDFDDDDFWCVCGIFVVFVFGLFVLFLDYSDYCDEFGCCMYYDCLVFFLDFCDVD